MSIPKARQAAELKQAMRRRTLLAATASGILAGRLGEPKPAVAETLRFPAGFLWGTATSSYQVEGRGDRTADSIWDEFARRPGAIKDGSNGDIACDHYHRYPEDIALMARMGVKAYRFSISWPRVLPDGTGQADQRGLDFYSRLVDALLAAGIEPWVCLFHWDLPQALQRRGGWGNRDIADWFAEYAFRMAAKLASRVPRWVLMNEPSVHAVIGHGLGEHAPGLKNRDAMFAAIHHLNLAQARALTALQVQSYGPIKIGTVYSLQPARPSSTSGGDRKAAAMWDALWNRAFLDPLFHGRYPKLLEPHLGKLVRKDDLLESQQKIDFLGVNYYSPMYQKADPGGLVGTNWGALPPGMKTTAMGWAIDPSGLGEVLADLRDHYGNPPVYITENGAFFNETAGAGGQVKDEDRVFYLRDHITAAHRAIAEGANLRGYFVWTILDNFEWAHGYTAKFGLVNIDRATLTRTPKASYDWFARIAQTNAV
jgi:beta-glucosidase